MLSNILVPTLVPSRLHRRGTFVLLLLLDILDHSVESLDGTRHDFLSMFAKHVDDGRMQRHLW